MPGNRTGGLKTAAINKAKDPLFYVKIGAKGQKAWRENGRKPRGFAANKDLARRAGSIGGTISSRRRHGLEPEA